MKSIRDIVRALDRVTVVVRSSVRALCREKIRMLVKEEVRKLVIDSVSFSGRLFKVLVKESQVGAVSGHYLQTVSRSTVRALGRGQCQGVVGETVSTLGKE